MVDFLSALGKKLKKNKTAMENYRRIYLPLKQEEHEHLQTHSGKPNDTRNFLGLKIKIEAISYTL